jgi:hypothetical protein
MGWLADVFGRTGGKPAKMKVSKDQLDPIMKNAIAEGKATLDEACVVHILDPTYEGPRIENWIIGEQVSRFLTAPTAARKSQTPRRCCIIYD